MKPTLCLCTDSLVPSGLGEHMLTVAAGLRDRYECAFVCPPTPAGRRLLEQARVLGLEPLPLTLRGDHRDWKRLHDWLRAWRADLFHGHAGVGWEGYWGIAAARTAAVPAVLRTEHLPYLITARWQQVNHRRLIDNVDRLIC